MELIKADDAPQVGVAEIDAQHATLIAIVNRLHQAMIQRRDRDTLAEILTELIGHTQQHFAYEEQLMSQQQYPDYAAHKADHDKLMQHITDVARRFRSGDLLLSFAVIVDLKAWATIHIEKSDRPLGIFLSRQGDQA